MNRGRRGIGTPGPDGRYVRVVERMTIYGEPIDFRTLCRALVTDKTRYLVLDLDRTLHLGRNIGELLGWELPAHLCYGEEFLKQHTGERLLGRFVFDWSRPTAVARYLMRGMRLWAYPGLLYLFAVKIGTRSDRIRRHVYLRFGTDPVAAVQEVPRIALLHQLAELPVEVLRKLARDVWRRMRDDQVITREDIAWLRETYPELRILISSASPQPVLEVAAEELGVDDILYTSIEQHGGYYSSPFSLHRLFLLLRTPVRIAPPSAVFHNAGHLKMDRILERLPDFLQVETVGITDTSYGEDHAWAQHFTKVADINSPNPFSPIVAAASPLHEIHSAQVLTRKEMALRAAGHTDYLDPKRKRHPGRVLRQFTERDLASLIGNMVPDVDQIAATYERLLAGSAAAMQNLEARAAAITSTIEQSVREYNESTGRRRRRALKALRHGLRQAAEVDRQLRKEERPLSVLMNALDKLMQDARKALEQDSNAVVPGQQNQ